MKLYDVHEQMNIYTNENQGFMTLFNVNTKISIAFIISSVFHQVNSKEIVISTTTEEKKNQKFTLNSKQTQRLSWFLIQKGNEKTKNSCQYFKPKPKHRKLISKQTNLIVPNLGSN